MNELMNIYLLRKIIPSFLIFVYLPHQNFESRSELHCGNGLFGGGGRE